MAEGTPKSRPPNSPEAKIPVVERTPEPGGLDWRQVTGLLRRVCRERQVVAADIVEVRPIPPSHITEYLAARLAYKIITYTQQ